MACENRIKLTFMQHFSYSTHTQILFALSKTQVLKSGWLVVKEEEDVWRTRYVKVYCRQRRVRLFVFADASSSIPVRSYNIHENTYAEIVDKNRDDNEDSSFVFRIFHQRRRKHRQDDDGATTSMSDMSHDDYDDDDDDDKEEGENNNEDKDFVARSSDMESTESWIELIQSLAVKLDMPAWMTPWHLYNNETRSKFAKSHFETIFNGKDDDDDDDDAKHHAEQITNVFDRARNEIDRLHSTCVRDRTLPRHDILDFMTNALICEMYAQKLFRDLMLKEKDEILRVYVSSNQLLVATQSASSSSSSSSNETFEKALDKISSLVECTMNQYVRNERENLSRNVIEFVSTFRVQDEIPKFRGTSALKGHNRVVVATRLGEKVKKCLESSLELVSQCETEMRSAILHECVSVMETYVTRLFARIRAPIFNGTYKEKLILSLANDVREIHVLLTTEASLIFDDIDEENSEIENLESVSWLRLSKLDRLISQHVENISRWIVERFVKSSVIVPTFEFAYRERPLHEHVSKLEKVMSVFLNFAEKELLSMCRWDVAKSFIVACSDVCTYCRARFDIRAYFTMTRIASARIVTKLD